MNGRRLLPVTLCLVVLAACAQTSSPRQAERHLSDPHVVPEVVEPGDVYVVERGVVTEEFRVNGVVLADGAEQVTVPYRAIIVEAPPSIGTVVAEGEILFVFAPTEFIRGVATELEAARFALAFGTGPTEQRTQRYESALANATALGIPTDDPAALPLPDTIEVLADEATTVLAVLETEGSTVEGGSGVLEIGNGDSLYARADVTDSVAAVVGINEAVEMTTDDDTATDGRIVFIDFESTDGQDIAVEVATTDLVAGDSVAIRRVESSGPAGTGTVESVVEDQNGPIRVNILLDEPAFVLDPEVSVAPRDDLDDPIPGMLLAVQTDRNGSSMRIAIPSGALDFGDEVRVTISGATSGEVTWLPPTVVREFDGTPFVLVRTDSGLVRVDLEFGIRTDERWEIVGDLAAGDRVVAP